VERKKPAIQQKQRANRLARKVFNMKAKLCFVALLLSFSVMPSFGITLIDGDATQNITTTGTSWVAYAITKDNAASVSQNGKEMILSAGGETLYADNTFLADTTMSLTITYDGGALSWTLNGITQGVVRPTVEFNAIEFKLWTDQAAGNQGGWELSNFFVNGNSVSGNWTARPFEPVYDVQTLFYITDFGTLSSISADLKLYSQMGTGAIPDFNMAQFSISGLEVIPEPSTVLLSVIGLGALLLTKISYLKR
jgi:hypothetical protein